jgi:two-component system NtrC family sensor kinase
MKTIRGKIISFSILCLAVASAVTAMFYQNAFSLRRKIYTIERFDDLLNDVLELRRYEKNLIFYRDAASLKEGAIYLLKVDNDFKILKDDIVSIIGMDECRAFSQNLVSYKQILDDVISMKEVRSGQKQVEKLRTEGKSLVGFAQRLIWIKRKRIDETLKRALAIPLACVGGLIVLVAVIFRFVNRGILKPLSMVEEATEKVAKESFTPIIYDKEKRDEITRLIASFNKMVEELGSRQEQLVQSRKLASIGTFTSGIAHELNNPLNNISITAETLMLNYHDMPEKEMDEMIGDILSQADRASHVVKNLLEFSRTERPYLIDLNITEVIERTVKLIGNQLIVSHIRLEKDIAADLPSIQGRRQDLQQAFVNILLNAIHAMPGGGVIKIRAGRGPKGYIKIDLSDTGTGIKPEALEHIFDPFYTTKESGQGTGLGLSLVYNIIRTHGGYIEVKSELNKGTTFSIYLPENSGKEDIKDEIQGSDRR